MDRSLDLSGLCSLSALLMNPVRFGPRFLESPADWAPLYTPLNSDPLSDASPRLSTLSPRSEPSLPPIPLPKTPSTVLFSPDRLLLDWTSVRPPPPGLINIGNSCYLNAVLQALSHIPPLVQYLLTGHHSLNCRLDNCVFCKLEHHVVQCYPGNAPRFVAPFKPLHIVSALRWISSRFQPYRQEDAHEFLRCLLGEMQRSCIRPYSNLDFASQETSVIYCIFGGYLCQQVTCLRCGHVSSTYPVYLDLSLDLAASLDDALAAYVCAERLAGPNRYRCEICAVLVDSHKQSTIYTAPPVLTLHLKRFTCAPRPAKLSRHVRYPEILDLSPYMSPHAPPDARRATRRANGQRNTPSASVHASSSDTLSAERAPRKSRASRRLPSRSRSRSPMRSRDTLVKSRDSDISTRVSVFGTRSHVTEKTGHASAPSERPYSVVRTCPVQYRLAAVVVHAGSDTRSGHYYAFCRASNGTWSRFNDDFVSTVGLQTVLAQQAYLLMYVRTPSS